MSARKFLFVFIVFGISVSGLRAQEENRIVDIVHLQNGVKLHGKILKYTPGKEMTFLTLAGAEVTVPDFQLKKIGSKNLGKLKIKGHYAIRDKGFYHTYSIALLTNSGPGFEGGLRGYEFGASFGHQFTKQSSLGAGISWDVYHPLAGEMVVPVFFEGRHYLVDKATTPYLQLRTGYGMALINPDATIREATGGWMINPMVGWRLSGRKGMNLSLDLGVKLQKASFTYESSSRRSDVDLLYKRLQVRMGFLF